MSIGMLLFPQTDRRIDKRVVENIQPELGSAILNLQTTLLARAPKLGRDRSPGRGAQARFLERLGELKSERTP